MTFPVPSTVRPATAEALKYLMQQLGIEEKDLEERFVRSSGPGGQHVNKTSTAVRIKHLPTGVEVRYEAHRSQAMNRFFARRLLCEKLAQARGQMTAADRKKAKAKKQKARRQRRSRSTSHPLNEKPESILNTETSSDSGATDESKINPVK